MSRSGSKGSRMHELLYLRDLLWELIWRDMRIRYKDSTLGLAWSLLQPLFQLAVFYFLFQKVLTLNIQRYSLFTLCGLLAWTWFHTSLDHAVASVRAGKELIKQPRFPSAVLPVAAIATNLITFLIAQGIVLLILLLTGAEPGGALLALPVVMGVQFLLTLSIAYPIAAINVVFRDTHHILGVMMQMAFFATPIFYDVSSVPEGYRWVYAINPMAHLVNAYREILIHGSAPEWRPLLILCLLSLVLMGFSLRFYRRMSFRFLEEL